MNNYNTTYTSSLEARTKKPALTTHVRASQQAQMSDWSEPAVSVPNSTGLFLDPDSSVTTHRNQGQNGREVQLLFSSTVKRLSPSQPYRHSTRSNWKSCCICPPTRIKRVHPCCLVLSSIWALRSCAVACRRGLSCAFLCYLLIFLPCSSCLCLQERQTAPNPNPPNPKPNPKKANPNPTFWNSGHWLRGISLRLLTNSSYN